MAVFGQCHRAMLTERSQYGNEALLVAILCGRNRNEAWAENGAIVESNNGLTRDRE